MTNKKFEFCHNGRQADDKIFGAFGPKLGELVVKNSQERSIKALLKYRTHLPRHLGEFCAADEKKFGCIFGEKKLVKILSFFADDHVR